MKKYDRYLMVFFSIMVTVGFFGRTNEFAETGPTLYAIASIIVCIGSYKIMEYALSKCKDDEAEA